MTPAEPEEVDLVARLVVGEEEAIGVEDVVAQPTPERPTGEAIQKVSGADALIVEDDLRHSVRVTLGDAVRQLDHVRRAERALLLLVCPVPGPITADDEAFHVTVASVRSLRMSSSMLRSSARRSYEFTMGMGAT